MEIHFFSTRLSSKEEGRSVGINLMKMGRMTAPPGNKKMAREGMDLKMSINCFCTFFFSLGLSSLRVDLDKRLTSSLLCDNSFFSLLLFLKMSLLTFLDMPS